MWNLIIRLAVLIEDRAILKEMSIMLRENPKKLLKGLFQSPQQYLKKIAKLPRAYRKRLTELMEKPEQLAKSLKSMGQKERKKFSEALQKQQKKSQEKAKLSSSWIDRGQWTPNSPSGNVGELVIWTKKGKVGYAYPGVSYNVWKAMKLAKGKNGGGAGSVFWALYLRAYKKSSFGQFLKKVQKLSGIKGFKI